MFQLKIALVSGLSLVLFLIITFTNNYSTPTKPTSIQAKNIDVQNGCIPYRFLVTIGTTRKALSRELNAYKNVKTVTI